MGNTFSNLKGALTPGSAPSSPDPTAPPSDPMVTASPVIGPPVTPATTALNTSTGLQPGGKNTTGPKPGSNWLMQGIGSGLQQGFQNYQNQQNRINKRAFYGG